jgi:hypothetical protein
MQADQAASAHSSFASRHIAAQHEASHVACRYRLAEVRHECRRLADHGTRRLVAVRQRVSGFLLGVAEGFAAARRYRRLSILSDGELRQLGVTRQDLAWFAVYGKPRR